MLNFLDAIFSLVIDRHISLMLLRCSLVIEPFKLFFPLLSLHFCGCAFHSRRSQSSCGTEPVHAARPPGNFWMNPGYKKPAIFMCLFFYTVVFFSNAFYTLYMLLLCPSCDFLPCLFVVDLLKVKSFKRNIYRDITRTIILKFRNENEWRQNVKEKGGIQNCSGLVSLL